jgi:hypothetical protein
MATKHKRKYKAHWIVPSFAFALVLCHHDGRYAAIEVDANPQNLV